MHATVIDTLRYASRLKDAGVDARQAEAMARAINDELTSGLATKTDVDHASAGLKADLEAAAVKWEHDLDGAVVKWEQDLDGAVVKWERNLDAAVTKMEGDLDAAVAKWQRDLDHAVVELKGEIARGDGKIDAVDDELAAKLDALNSKLEAQGRYVFLVLALIAALGLYNAAAPHLGQHGPRASSGGTTSITAPTPKTEAATPNPTRKPSG